jgi:hypothetical protein
MTDRMAYAKHLMTRAALAALRAWPLAEVMAAAALAELEAARREEPQGTDPKP